MKTVLSRTGRLCSCPKFLLLNIFIFLFSVDLVIAQSVTVTGTENNINISKVNLSIGSSTIEQTSPSGNSNPSPLDAPVLVESVVLENGEEIFVTSRRPQIANPNPLLGSNTINGAAVEIINSNGPSVSHYHEDFISSLTEVVSTPDLRSYWSIGAQPSIAMGERFVDLIYPFPSSGYILFSERNGNSAIDFVALGLDGKPIPGATTVQVRGYQWDTGINHATDNPSQKQWLVVFSPSLFNTLQPVNGVRVISINEPDGKLVFFVGNLAAAPDQAGPINNATEAKAVLNILDNDELNEAPVQPFDVEISVITPFPDNTLIFNADGTVDVPANTPPGIYTMTYEITDVVGGESDQASVTVRVFEMMPEANDDFASRTAAEGATAVVDVLENDLLNGEAATLDNVILSEVSNSSNGILSLNQDGTVDVAAGVQPGTYRLTYQICDKANPSKCDTAAVAVFIGVTELLAADDNFGTYNQNGVIGNVLLNDRINGIPVSPNQVIATITDNGGLEDLVIEGNGILRLPKAAPSGSYVVVYQLAESLNPNNTDAAEVRFTVRSTTDITAINDSGTTNQNQPIDIAVLDNDTSPTGGFNLNALTVTISPANGTASVNANGTISYSPAPNFVGEDRFTYSTCDDQDGACTTAVVTVTVRPILLELEKTVDRTAVSEGEIVVYTISLTNSSQFGLTGITLEDILPEQLTYLSSSSEPSAANTWAFAEMAAGDKLSMTIEALATTAGTATNTATVRIGAYEISAQSPSLTIGSKSVDLRINKTSSGVEIYAGNEFVYEILVENIGGTDAKDVVVTDNLPAGISYVSEAHSASAEGIDVVSAVNGNQVTWSVAFLPAGATLNIQLTVKANKTGATLNRVEVVSTSQDETNPDDNRAEDLNEVLEFFIPNVITPAARDNKNDQFVIKGINRFSTNRLIIFNRWGNHIFEATDYQNDWAAAGVSAGSYYYVLEVVDSNNNKQTFNGWIQVIKD